MVSLHRRNCKAGRHYMLPNATEVEVVWDTILGLLSQNPVPKPPKCPSTDESINKMWYNHTAEYYSIRKRNEVQVHA